MAWAASGARQDVSFGLHHLGRAAVRPQLLVGGVPYFLVWFEAAGTDGSSVGSWWGRRASS